MEKLRICIIGNYSGRLDEGMGNIAFNLYESFQNEFEGLILLNVDNIFKTHFWKKLFSFKPDIIHFIPGPTMKTLFLIKICKILTNCKTVVTATRPVLPNYFKKFANILKPDILIAQSKTDFEFFKELKYNAKFIPNGVDINKFHPVDEQKKKELRQKFRFEDKDFIVLHIGPINKARNQAVLVNIKDVKILLIVSVTNESSDKEIEFLSKHDVIIWKKYFEDVQEIYQMSDVYVFPGFEELNSIQIPLSVLEAMSCNLPVISTKFGGLEEILSEGGGLYYVNNSKELIETVLRVQNSKEDIKTREKVEKISWKNVTNEIVKLYEETYQIRVS